MSVQLTAQPTTLNSISMQADPEIENALKRLRERVEKDVSDYSHDRIIDSLFYNGGTVVLLICTTAATLLPQEFSVYARIMTGIAAFLVGLERALNFGARWRFHREIQTAYVSVIDMIDFYEVVPAPDKTAYLQQIRQELAAVRQRAGTGVVTDTPATTVAGADKPK